MFFISFLILSAGTGGSCGQTTPAPIRMRTGRPSRWVGDTSARARRADAAVANGGGDDGLRDGIEARVMGMPEHNNTKYN